MKPIRLGMQSLSLKKEATAGQSKATITSLNWSREVLSVFVGLLTQAHRVVVIGVLLINAHTWGLNSSYAVFLAYYLRSGTIEGASPLGFAFVGGLSISICKSSPFGGCSE